ncbi:MAG: UDP-glucose 4-epimerase [candidate division TM6 bacterium GW2011_GWE2_36_25]|nr:MAG: UDP-glucose 4-epimerase [candidate division TM6 bacterium GW2011_GWF2_36_131]KKQ03773.1 MAG: UDP-glucose 4-epimerase [candidate division TM6 bacterium GW2011_GWE2_36_25]KKQ19918.1 MAG: UDP-glucose 4-epimerase [candidate division TM6 bacterium GW2011_GWA2_36_9]
MQKVYMKESILITGGAGYIGSHTAYLLAQKGYHVIILDDFYYKQPFNHSWATVIKGNVCDDHLLDKIFSQFSINAIMHFAGFIAVGESVQNPFKYYDNNVVNTLTLLKKAIQYKINKFIFSSSAAVYGLPDQLPLKEDHKTLPVNAYGNTKLVVEYLLSDVARAYDFKFVALRYFNACGAEFHHGLGEYHQPETHIIPLAIRAAMSGKEFKIFGNDYDTPDQTCIRDYLHVADLALAHEAALNYLKQGGLSEIFNLGTGRGYSVKEILTTVEKVCGQKLQIKICERREGDPAILIADPAKAQKYLGWNAKNSHLEKIISDAYQFERLSHRESHLSKEAII